MRSPSMHRAIVIGLLVAGCGGFGAVRTVGDRRVGVQEHAVGLARFVSFVNVKRSIVDAESGAGFAMVLPGGDWLAQINGATVRLAPDGETQRWSARGFAIWDAVIGRDGHVICVGTIADPKALNGEARSLFDVDTATGAILWRTEAAPIVSGASAKLARVGDITVAASAYGEAAVDDTGKVAWVAKPREHGDDPLIAPIAHGVVVISTPERNAADFTGGPVLHRPLVVRTLDIATGAQLGRFELAADNDFWSAGELGFSRDGRIGLQAADVRVEVEQRTLPEGIVASVQTNVSAPRLVVIDAGDPASPSARATALPTAAPAPMPASLAASELVFVERYATDGEALAMVIVDIATAQARRVPLLRTAKHASYVQFTQLAVRADQISFAGMFTGQALPLRARVEKVDWCEAQHGVECFGGHDDVTLSPAAAVIGSVRFAPAH